VRSSRVSDIRSLLRLFPLFIETRAHTLEE
jgi:hypothetical protein